MALHLPFVLIGLRNWAGEGLPVTLAGGQTLGLSFGRHVLTLNSLKLLHAERNRQFRLCLSRILTLRILRSRKLNM